MFRLLQWSDSHADATCTAATQNLISNTPNLDLCVHCGDIARDNYQDGTNTYNKTLSVCVIVNHDALDNSGTNPYGYEWYKQPSQAALYNSYLAESKSHFKLDMSVNTTWWSKEFTDKGVLVLGLNDTVPDSIRATEIEWLINRLAYAKDNNLGLIIAKHGPSLYMNLVENSFSSTYMTTDLAADENYYANQMYPGTEKLMTPIVQTDARVLCILCGHTHADGFFYVNKNDSTRIPVINIGSTIIDKYNDVARINNSSYTTAVVANIIEYDNSSDALRVYRLGADGCSNGAARKMLSHSYKENKVVSICSVR